MVSNGYLFNPTLICEAVDVWKLRKIQITLDGTESVYEKIKQFGDKQSFQKVIENIRLTEYISKKQSALNNGCY